MGQGKIVYIVPHGDVYDPSLPCCCHEMFTISIILASFILRRDDNQSGSVSSSVSQLYLANSDAGKGSTVCSSLHCGTRYLIAVLALRLLRCPVGRGAFPGGQVRFLGDFGVLEYPPSGVARQSHCTPALLSIS